MKCPHCGKDIDDKMLSRHLGAKGGAKSKRALTSEQARLMVAMRGVASRSKRSEKKRKFKAS